MSIYLLTDTQGRILTVRLTGRLTAEDYEHFVPEVDRLIKAFGKIRMLVDMQDFHGWTAGAFWEDAKFGIQHYSGIERLAIVGERCWEKAMTAICKPFTAATVRYFDRSHFEEAAAWIHKDLPPS